MTTREGTVTEPQTRRRRIIERPRLTRLLDESQGRIKMLVAPAGYGKTTLARQWLEGKRAVWYTATPASVDVAALAAGIRKTVLDVAPGAGDALIERLPVTRAGEESRLLASMLSADLEQWPSNIWLVLDDYHEVAGSAPAEGFVETLITDAPLNVLLLTRRRPAWASSRRLLYGELFEVERSQLAMDESEARALLDDEDPELHEIVSLAQGWPAVLALAGVLTTPLPELAAAPQLYGFFADEIYRRLDRRVRTRLCELALYDVDGRQIALRQLRGDEAERVVNAGLACGFLTEVEGGPIEVHPLVRNFLQRKLREEHPKRVVEIVARAVRNLIDYRLWDEAGTVIRQFGRDDLIPQLLESSLDELLAAGRSATVEAWISDSGMTAPVVRLATAELAFREGRFYESEALAALAANDLVDSPGRAARACFVAGRAAHVASRETKSRDYYRQARTLATDPVLERQAAFGELVATIELEDPQATDLLAALTTERPLSPADEVLLADRQLAYETRFAVPVDLQRGRAASQLLRFVIDPVARTSFRNVFGYALASTAHWDEATRLTEEQLTDAQRCRLDFVTPYAFAIHALVATGRRAYDEGASLLDDAEARATKTGDIAALQLTAAVRMRMHISRGAFDLALACADIDLSTATRSMKGELASIRALAHAALGQVGRARELAEAALGTSIGVETVVNAHCALAVCALNQNDPQHAVSHAQTALERAVYTGMIESFVAAYRGCPELIVSLLEVRERHEQLALVLSRAGDASLATVVGTEAEHSVMSLSPREKEVLALIAQGLSNAAIGKALFISPVTVKVHVRHIYDKLGVRSRAAAVLRATQLNRD